MTNEEKIKKIMEIAEKSVDEDVLMSMKMAINEGHHDEWTSRYAVSQMIPVCYVGMLSKPKSVCEWMDILGITPSKAYDMVYAHYDASNELAANYGISAPKLNANMWDCWWCVAMMLSDYWITVAGEPDKAYQLAYEYLSDPDKK